MSRKPRTFSKSGYMHLIVRGIGKQIIFEDHADYNAFITRLERFSSDTEMTVLAYCLMENHVHLLVCDPAGNTSKMMKNLELSYARFFNDKYERVGHLFQNRYRNVNIENETQLLIVFRYILNNPVKAGICSAAQYKWSSYSQYESGRGFVDTSVIRKLLGDHHNYVAFLMQEDDYDRNVSERPGLIKDDLAKELIIQKLHINSAASVQNMNRKTRNEALRILKQEGLSIRQIERLTGISRSVIQRA